MRLLVVEDEAKTANFLAKGLGESGFAVDDLAELPLLSQLAVSFSGRYEALGGTDKGNLSHGAHLAPSGQPAQHR